MAIPANTVAPSFTGLLRLYATQAGSAGTWTGSPSFAYQWQRAEPVTNNGFPVFNEGEAVTGDWENIAGATSINYVAANLTVAYYLRLRVIGTNGDGSATAYSAQRGPLLGAFSPAAPNESLSVSFGMPLWENLAGGLNDED